MAIDRSSSQSDESPPFHATIELFVITFLALALSWWFSPDDILLSQAPFPWVLAAPLLISLRYGFAYGLASVVVLVSLPFALQSFGLLQHVEMSMTSVVGIGATTLFCGEYRDLWYRKLSQKEFSIRYQQTRLNEFTRQFYLLKASHDRMEQQLTSEQNSLRSALANFRQELIQLKRENKPIAASLQTALRLMCNTCSIQVAGIYQIVDGRLNELPLARIGVMESELADDALVQLALEKRHLITVRNEDIELVNIRKRSKLLVCAPVMEANGDIHAIVAVQAMPFYAFGTDNLRLLSLLCGYLVDVYLDLMQSRHSLLREDVQMFMSELNRCIEQKVQHDLDSYITVVELHHSLQPQQILEQVELAKRGLDVIQSIPDNEGNLTILVLLPLTDSRGAEGYETRLSLMVYEHLGLPVDASKLRILTRPLQKDDEGVPLLKDLINGCEILKNIHIG